MNVRKLLLIKLIIIVMTLVITHPCFPQAKGEEIASFYGQIDHIPKDSNFIVVNEQRVFITPNTKIVSERGSILKIDHLKRRLHVVIEGVQKPEGIFADKIIILRASKKNVE
jgi:hypothetical protein